MSCIKATYLLEKEKFTPLSLFEKLRKMWHLLICHWCRKYKSDSAVIDQWLAAAERASHKIKLSAQEEKRLREILKL